VWLLLKNKRSPILYLSGLKNIYKKLLQAILDYVILKYNPISLLFVWLLSALGVVPGGLTKEVLSMSDDPGVLPVKRLIFIIDIDTTKTFRVVPIDEPTLVAYKAHMTATGKPRFDMPPIMIHEVRGKLVMVDGNHRVTAAKAVGLRKVPALIWYDSTNTDATIAAAGANLRQGLRMTVADKRNAARGLLTMPRPMPIRQVAKAVDLHRDTVTKVKRELEALAARELPVEGTPEYYENLKPTGAQAPAAEGPLPRYNPESILKDIASLSDRLRALTPAEVEQYGARILDALDELATAPSDWPAV
jgi:ParB-like chromosome segregation protein Spo0J